MIFGFLVNMENTIAIYSYFTPIGPFVLKKWCVAPEYFVLISFHCSTQIWRMRYGGSWSIYFLIKSSIIVKTCLKGQNNMFIFILKWTVRTRILRCMMLFSLHLLGTWFLLYNVQLSVVYSMFPPRLMRRMCTSLNGQQLKVINFIVVYCSCKKRKEMKDYYVKSPASLPPEDTTPDLETWNLELSRVRHRLELSRVLRRLETGV